MAIEFVCPSCQGTLSMGDDAAGRVVRCGSCMATLRVPVPPALEREPHQESEPPPPTRLPRAREREEIDEYGEPRRRSSRKRKSRGTLFWLVIVALCLGFSTCLVCGGIMLVIATPHWRQHESPDGGYQVEYPAPISPEIGDQAKVNLKANQHVEGAFLAGRMEAYWVAYAEIERPRPKDDDLLKKAVENLAAEVSGTVVREMPKTVNGHPAREVVLSLKDGTIHCLIVIANSRAYVAAAGGQFVTPAGNKRIRKFLDSFQIVDVKAGNPWRGKP
jgi:hypothetical protein